MVKRYRDLVGDGGSDVAGQLADHRSRLRSRMSGIKSKIAVMSGKGGVGKSTMTANLAVGLARNGFAVGVLDADIYGPSLAQMFGVRGQGLEMGGNGIAPVETDSGIKLMSMDFLLPEERSPVYWQGPQEESFAWKGMLEMHALREFLTDTRWGALDYLLVDLPPGTNQFATLCELLGDLDGTLVVTIPSRVSRLVVQRGISMAREVLKAPVTGIVENMTGYYCEGCDRERPLFGAGLETDYQGLPLLGRVPFDPRMTHACDEGWPFLSRFAHTPSGEALLEVCGALVASITSQQSKVET